MGVVLQVTEQQTETAPEREASTSTELFLIQTRPSRTILYLAPATLGACEAMDGDHIRNFINRLVGSQNAVIRWIGRVTRTGHSYYQKLEDKIDPLERMIKAINRPHSLIVRHSSGTDAEKRFRDLLRWQKRKHLAWLMIDGTITAVAALLAPFLVPIPGPNLFFYYPVLRLLSHYRAVTGASRGLNGIRVTFEQSPDLTALEANLRAAGGRSAMGEAAAGMNVQGLGRFLERMA